MLDNPMKAAIAGALMSLTTLAAHAAGVTIAIACGSGGLVLELCKKNGDEWAAKTGNTVKYLATPGPVSDLLSLYRQLLAAKSTDVDVLSIDVIWPGTMKDQLIDLKPYTNGIEQEHFPAIVANNTVGGKLVAMPWFTDAGLLYYRKDLLSKYGEQPPTTWQELAASAKRVMEAERKAGNAAMQGFVFQGRAAEGLTCNALEWVASSGGGTVVDSSGKVTINNPAAAKALSMAASWVGTIAPTGVLNYAEEDARGVFQRGDAVFMRNWPYAWSLTQGNDSPVKGKVAVVALPKGEGSESSASALGGSELAVSKYSRHPKEAADLVMYMTRPAAQKEVAIVGGFIPTFPALFKDVDVLKANPFYGELYQTFITAIPRPSTVTGARYNEVSAAFWNAAHDVLDGTAKAEESLKKLEGKLNSIRRGPSW